MCRHATPVGAFRLSPSRCRGSLETTRKVQHAAIGLLLQPPLYTVACSKHVAARFRSGPTGRQCGICTPWLAPMQRRAMSRGRSRRSRCPSSTWRSTALAARPRPRCPRSRRPRRRLRCLRLTACPPTSAAGCMQQHGQLHQNRSAGCMHPVRVPQTRQVGQLQHLP